MPDRIDATVDDSQVPGHYQPVDLRRAEADLEELASLHDAVLERREVVKGPEHVEAPLPPVAN